MKFILVFLVGGFCSITEYFHSKIDNIHKYITIVGVFVTVGFAILSYNLAQQSKELTIEYRENKELINTLQKEFVAIKMPFLQAELKYDNFDKKKKSNILHIKFFNAGGHIKKLTSVKAKNKEHKHFTNMIDNFAGGSTWTTSIHFQQNSEPDVYKFHFMDVFDNKFEQTMTLHTEDISITTPNFSFPKKR